MKALPRKLLRLTLFGVAVTSLFSVQPIQGFTITMKQDLSNVVATGSGAINLTGLSFIEEASIGPLHKPTRCVHSDRTDGFWVDVRRVHWTDDVWEWGHYAPQH